MDKKARYIKLLNEHRDSVLLRGPKPPTRKKQRRKRLPDTPKNPVPRLQKIKDTLQNEVEPELPAKRRPSKALQEEIAKRMRLLKS